MQNQERQEDIYQLEKSEPTKMKKVGFQIPTIFPKDSEPARSAACSRSSPADMTVVPTLSNPPDKNSSTLRKPKVPISKGRIVPSKVMAAIKAGNFSGRIAKDSQKSIAESSIASTIGNQSIASVASSSEDGVFKKPSFLTPWRAGTGFRTPEKQITTSTARSRTPGSSGSRLGKRTPGSVGRGKLFEDNSTARNYDNKEMGLKSAKDVRKLLKAIRRKESSGVSETLQPIVLRDLVEKELHKSKTKVATKTCSQNLIGQFNEDKNDPKNVSSVSAMLDSNISSSLQLQQEFEKLMLLDEEKDESTQNENEIHIPNYEILLKRLAKKTANYNYSYDQHAKNILKMDRNEIIDLDAFDSATESVTRFHNTLSTMLSNKNKILHESVTKKNESIPCSFDSRLKVVNSIQRLELAISHPLFDNKWKIPDESHMNKQITGLKDNLDKLEKANEEVNCQNDQTNKLQEILQRLDK